MLFALEQRPLTNLSGASVTLGPLYFPSCVAFLSDRELGFILFSTLSSSFGHLPARPSISLAMADPSVS